MLCSETLARSSPPGITVVLINQMALALKGRTDGFKQGLDFATVSPFFLY
jgi:hypothetical protein